MFRKISGNRPEKSSFVPNVINVQQGNFQYFCGLGQAKSKTQVFTFLYYCLTRIVNLTLAKQSN